jgi:adenylate cyclase
MAEKGFKRKLTAILSADVVGYSRLMDQDEEATIRTLTAYRSVITDMVQQYRGRVVDTPGDNILAEFNSVIDAVNCSVEIQRDLAHRNAELTPENKMEFRIGVNVGDVVAEEDRIYGDGVNIAARVEAMAEAGGICITGRAYDQVKNKLELGYKYLGEHSVKNIAEPVRVYKVLMEPDAAGKVIGEKKFLGKISRRSAIAAIIIYVNLNEWSLHLWTKWPFHYLTNLPLPCLPLTT